MTLKNILALGFISATLLACVPKDTTNTTSASTTTASTSATSYASCGALSGFTSLALCKTGTSAQCFPSDKNIQGTTQTCYFPVDGWAACATNQAAWSYGAWGNWCIPTGYPSGTYLRSRTATCTKSISACDCTTDAAATDICSLGNNYYTACPFSGIGGISSCDATPTPTTTPVPTATPSQTAAWCNSIYLDYPTTDSNGAGVLRDLNSGHYLDISNYFRARGYYTMFIRSASGTVTPFGDITAAELQHNYTVQISASKAGCFLGNKITVNVTLLQGNNATSGAHVISQSTDTSACISFGDEAGRSLNRALNKLNPVNCY